MFSCLSDLYFEGSLGFIVCMIDLVFAYAHFIIHPIASIFWNYDSKFPRNLSLLIVPGAQQLVVPSRLVPLGSRWGSRRAKLFLRSLNLGEQSGWESALSRV